MTNPTSQLPFVPQALPRTQGDWQQTVNVLQNWQQQITAPVWSALTLVNGFSQYPLPYNPAAYYLDVTGRVWVRGLLLMPNTVVDGTTIATLPNPPKYEVLTIAQAFNGTAYSPARIDVDIAGNIFIEKTLGSLNGGGWVSLDQLNYSILP